MRVMSFNIRQDNDPEYSWGVRKGRVISVIRFHRPDLLGLQEPSAEQLEDLRVALSEFSFFRGASLEEGETGAHNPIFFRKERFGLLDSGFFYLSQTPHVLSKGWDARFLRGATWVKLLDRGQGKSFYFFNTHFDYHGRKARDQSAYLLREKVAEIARSLPFVVAGDFNLFPDLGGEETYQILTKEAPKSRPFVDAQKVAKFPHHGPTGTWSGFKEPGQPGVKPDFIFIDARIQVHLHGVLTDTFDGHFPSDHLPVVAEIALP